MLLHRVLLFAALIGLTVSAEFFTRKKRSSKEDDDDDIPYGFYPSSFFPFPSVATYAGTGGAFAGAGNFFSNPFTFVNPFFPFPVIQFKWPKPWYEGPNVCKEKVTFTDSETKQFLDFLGDGSSNWQRCKEDPQGRKCIKGTFENGQWRVEGEVITCCQGTTRSMDSPGCVKRDANIPPSPPVAPQNPGKPFYPQDTSGYNFYSNGDDFNQ